MAKIMYQGKTEIKGKISFENGTLATIELDGGGTMIVSRADIKIVPDKEEKRKAKKEYKKATDTDVVGVESEE